MWNTIKPRSDEQRLKNQSREVVHGSTVYRTMHSIICFPTRISVYADKWLTGDADRRECRVGIQGETVQDVQCGSE